MAKTFRSKPFAGSGLQPRHMAITAWAVASLIRCRALKLCGADFARLLGALGEAAVPQLPEFDGQSLSNLLWGLAVARQVHRRVFFVASRRAIQLLKRGDLVGQNLSNVLWSFSQARLPNHALFEEAARHPEIFAESHQPSPQHITNILWAFSRIHGKIGMFRDFFDAGAEAAISKLHLFKTQELANILWTFANQTLHHDGLFSAVADHARGRIAEFENFDLSQLLWSFAKVWWRDEELLREAAQDMLHGKTRRLKQMCAQDLGCVLWAFAMLQWQDAGLFEALAQAVRQHFATLKPLDVGNVAWALAVSEQMDVQTAKLIADHVLSVAGFGTAEGWVHILSGLQPLSASLGNSRWESLLSRFEGTILRPLCHLSPQAVNCNFSHCSQGHMANGQVSFSVYLTRSKAKNSSSCVELLPNRTRKYLPCVKSWHCWRLGLGSSSWSIWGLTSLNVWQLSANFGSPAGQKRVARPWRNLGKHSKHNPRIPDLVQLQHLGRLPSSFELGCTNQRPGGQTEAACCFSVMPQTGASSASS